MIESLQPYQYEYPDSQFQCINVRSVASAVSVLFVIKPLSRASAHCVVVLWVEMV